MSDYSTSSFAAPEVEQPTSLLAGTASQFSAPRFDRNLRALQEVESTWRLPGLPDVVKYDLASLDTDEAGIKDLLLGLDTELNEQPAARPSRLEVPKPSITGLQQLQVILAANTNNPAPTELSDDAVKEWQREAVRRGVLDEDTDVDGVWRPEYNRMKREMAWDRQNEALRGNRPGAMPVTGENGIMKLINDFTSPAGLLSAATELDLFWDIDAIENEFRSWGDKWREVGRSKNPLDFAGNLIDALTGPIDDLLVPVVNNVMLVSGVGTAFNVGRAFMAGRGAYAATRVAQSAQAFERIYNMGRVGSWIERAGFGARAAANIDEIGRAGMLANRFQKMGGAPAVVGRGMEAWRQFTPVRASKELVQQGMRLGTMATLQNDYMGSYASDGASLNQLPGVERLQSGLEVVKASPLGMIPEVALAPYNVFSPGTFVNRTADSVGLGNLLGQKVFQGLGTIGGRAAAGALVGTVAGTIAGDDAGDIALGAAIGAAGAAAAPAAGRALASTPGAGAARGAAVGALAGAWLGDDPQDALLGAAAGAGLFAVTDTARQAFAHTVGASKWNKFVKGAGRALEMTSFKPLVDNNERIGLSFNTGMRRWLQDDPDGLARWDDAFGRSGLYGALEETLGLDAESAAGFVGFTYLSSAIDWIATAQAGGKGDDFYERYLMFRTKLTSQLRHIPNVEAPTTAMLDDLAGAMARAELGHANYQKVTARARQLRKQMEANPAEALKLANEHNMRATETVRQLFNPENFPAAADDLFADVPLADQVGRAIGPEWASMASSPDQLGTVMVGYMPQMMESFGRWDNFTVATAQIRDLRASGLFDDIALKGFKDRTGKVRPPRSAKRTVNQQAQKLAQDMDDLTLEGKLGERVAKMTPFAPANEHGRITVMRIDGVTQQDLEEVAERLADVKKAHEYWQSAGAGAAKLYKEVGEEFAGRLKAKSVEQLLAGTSLGPADSLKDFTDAQIKVVAQELAGKLKGKKGFEYLLNFARRHDLSFADMDDALARMTDEIVNDAAMWRKFGLADTITDADGLAGRVHGVDALSLRLKEVQRKARTTAAEVDLDELTGRLDGPAAQQIRDLQEWMTENGYKAVHGREFLMPEDVAFGDMMFDVTRRHLNAATIGNWFKGKTPIEQKLVNDRRRRLALVDELSKAGKDYHPEDQDVTNILGDLQEFMRQEHDRVTELMRLSHEETFGKRMVDRLRSSFSPVDIADAGANKKKLISFLKNERGLSDELAEAAWRATHKFRSTDFQDVGLYALEAKARSMNVAEWGLKTLTGSKYEGIIQRARGPMAGAAAGATIGAVQTLDDPDMSFEDKVRAAARGAAIGAGAAVAGQVLGTAASEGIGTALTKFNIGAGGSLVDRSANWRYGYIGDWAARARDSLRFTLSPFFDISRYTEGFMLAQTAAPTRLADGSRNVMPLNMSPSGLRRRIAKLEGLTKEQARIRYDGYMSEFARAARGDFDPEAMAEAGKWFKQVGIMGFSPTDWMGTAFAQMRLNGIDPETAYRSAREMYTYATKGRTARSAAEMSANFIVFPFSFQKKALTHIGKWMNDDLARSIMIHDALKTYEILDKEYDLDQFWKDHVPMMRQLQRLNMFAYGLSAGRFGGINSQLFEGAGKVAWNLFVPANLEIKDAAAAKEAQDIFRQLMPAINDINWMIDNVKETGNVMFSDQHVTSSAQVRRGYDEWYEFKEQFEEEIARQGYTFGEVMNSEWTQDIANIYRQKQAELERKYPAWVQARIEGAQENMAITMERQDRIASYELAVAEGRVPKPDNRMVFEMEQLIGQAKEDAAFFSDGGSTELPVAYMNQIRDLGMSFARKNPGFIGLWKKFYEREFGPLDVTLSM